MIIKITRNAEQPNGECVIHNESKTIMQKFSFTKEIHGAMGLDDTVYFFAKYRNDKTIELLKRAPNQDW